MSGRSRGTAAHGPWSRRDFVVAAAITASIAVASLFALRAQLAAGVQPFFYQDQFGPAVLRACGRSLENPRSPELPSFARFIAFLSRQQESFDCGSLPATFETQPLNLFQGAHRYLLGMAAVVWRLAGVSWSALAWISAAFAGLTAGFGYLFLRGAMPMWLAALLALIYASSPVQLNHLPQLRDYAKAPFLVFMLCVITWVATSRASRMKTIAAMAVAGIVLGFGFGIRTDVLTYLLFVLIALVAFRPDPDASDFVTRGAASLAAVACFLLVATPVLRVYQGANNLAHVAVLGLTDPSRDWLSIDGAPYSYGYLYNDGYVATTIAAFAERQVKVDEPVLLGTPAYSRWGNDYYGRLLRTFPADTLTRAWAAVIGVLNLPFTQNSLTMPPWLPQWWAPVVAARSFLLSWMSVVPPVIVAAALIFAISAYSVRLAVLALGLLCLLCGTTAVQFQDRHIFQLEILPMWVFGCAVTGPWRLGRGWRHAPPRTGELRVCALRAVSAAAVFAVLIVAPVAASRRYQAAPVRELLASYESAATTAIETTAAPAADPSQVIVRTPLPSAPKFVDSNMLMVEIGGEHCDADVLSLTFRYHVRAPYTDLSRRTVVPVAPPASPATRVLFPVLTLGGRMPPSEVLSFIGVELPKEHQGCIMTVRRFTNPDTYPLLLEAVLRDGWDQRNLHEVFRGWERSDGEWHFDSYAIPDGLQPGRRWLSQVENVSSKPTFRSRQVKRLEAGGIEVRGAADQRAAYLLSWPYEARARGSAFLVEGEVFEGGLTIGLQQDERWVHQLNVYRPGRFRAVVRVDADGTYGPILANHQLRGLYNRSTITRYGWLPPME